MPQGRRISHTQIEIYWDERGAGKSQPEASIKAGIGLSTAAKLERARRDRNPINEQGRMSRMPDPLIRAELSPKAKRALDDFGYFQRRYFGRIAYPWQVEAAEKVVELLSSPDKEYLVVNCPPGSGKSSLFAHDIPAWLTVRNRKLRGMIGSATTNLAEGYCDRLRRTLARTLPVKNSDEDIARGLALDAESTLAHDFGRFQAVGDIWTRGSFVVQQYEDMGAVSEKEATWSAYGQDAGYIGQRFDFVIWDDLVDPKKQRTQEAREALELYWDDVSEPRLEPAGLLVLQGQRFASDDLYRYCLDKITGEDFDWDSGELLERRPKYHHVLFKAHYDERCNPSVTHKRMAAPYPEGCLLSPQRLPWRELSAHIENRGDRFEVVYQQQDGDPASVLVPKIWIYGGDGFPGCTDEDRDRLELPKNADGSIALNGPLVSYMTVDPSPTRYWAIEWWLYQPSVEYRWLMDLERRPMEANEFLDFNHATQRFTGLLEEWWQTSTDLQIPLTHVIVEDNAAQRFLLQYDTVRQWMGRRNVEIIPHSTHRNKSDPEFGVESIREHYKFGRKRLPFKRNSDGFIASMKLINELTTYPHGRTDDCVMADWFGEWNLPRIYAPEVAEGKQWRPSWAGSVPGLRTTRGVESGAMAMMARAGYG
jgi:hypothetical protein